MQKHRSAPRCPHRPWASCILPPLPWPGAFCLFLVSEGLLWTLAWRHCIFPRHRTVSWALLCGILMDLGNFFLDLSEEC